MSDCLAINNFPLPHHEEVESFIEMDYIVLDCATVPRVRQVYIKNRRAIER